MAEFFTRKLTLQWLITLFICVNAIRGILNHDKSQNLDFVLLQIALFLYALFILFFWEDGGRIRNPFRQVDDEDFWRVN